MSMPIRVCMNAATVRSLGITTYGDMLCRHLASRDDVSVALLLPPDSRSHLPADPGSVQIRVLGGGYASRQLRLHMGLRRYLSQFDLVHSIGNIGLLSLPCAQVITIHDTYERVSPHRFPLAKRLAMRLLISRSGRRAQRIIAVSENTRRDVARYYPALATRTVTVYSGSSLPAPEQPDDGTDASTAPDMPTFLFVGTMEPGKSLATALRALSLYNMRAPTPATLRIVGDRGWGPHGVHELVRELGLERQVTLVGYVTNEELVAEYRNAWALVFPSSYEGFGLPVIEAMSCGCPVLAARNSAIIEAGGDAALFFDTFDADALAQAMDRVVRDAPTRRSMIAKGRSHAARFDWRTTAAETLEVYHRAIAAKRGP